MAAAAERLNRRPDRGGAKPKGRVVNGNVRLGRVGGVEVRINWSWLVILALIVWSLADGVGPDDLGSVPGSILGLSTMVAALLFFASLLLHEPGHAWRRRGEKAWRSTGSRSGCSGRVAVQDADSERRRRVQIAIAGPLVSLVSAWSSC